MQEVLIDTEKIKQNTFQKLDQFKYDYGTLSSKYNFKKFDNNISTNSNDKAIKEIKNKSKVENDYRKKLDKRLDVINEKINEYSYNSNAEISNFLSTTFKTKPNNTLQENKEDYFDYTILKESKNEFNEGKFPSDNNNDFINLSTNVTQKINNKNITKNNNLNKISSKSNNINNNKISSPNNNNINNNLYDTKNVINEKSMCHEHSIIESNLNKSTNKIIESCMNSIREIKRCQSERFPTKVQIVCKRDVDLIKKNQKQNIYLKNQMNILEKKISNMEKQKEFLHNLIFKNEDIKKYMNDILMVEYFEKIAGNWSEITNELIDDLIMDEILELGQIKKKEKENEKKNGNKINEIDIANNKELNRFEIEEFELFNKNLDSIKTIIKSVKETERNLCRKYKVKINKKLY